MSSGRPWIGQAAFDDRLVVAGDKAVGRVVGVCQLPGNEVLFEELTSSRARYTAAQCRRSVACRFPLRLA
jgi:hypothetical protein